LRQTTSSVGLSAEQLSALFPFHFVINRAFKFVQTGTGITEKFDHGIKPGAYLDEFFEITTPASLLNWGYLRSMENEICSLRHRKTQIDFSARIFRAGEDRLIFILKPLINTSAYLEQLGLEVTDFSNHDLIHDLFQHKQHSYTKSKISLSDALIAQQDQLNEIRHLLANQEAESRKLAHIISRSTYWIIIANAQGRIEWLNDAFLRSSGYTQEEALGREFNLLFDLPEAEFAELYRTLRSGGSVQKEIKVSNGNETRWIDIDIRALTDDRNEIINFIAIGRDITEQKQAQLLNERLSAELNTIFDLSPDGFVSFDEHGKLSQLNNAFLRMTGLDQDQLTGIDAESFTSLLDSLNEYAQSADSAHLADIIRISKPKLTILRHSIKTVPDAEGKRHKVIHYFQDITHEYELSRMKGEFLSAAAHELRTPMASIYGFTDLLIKRDYDQAQTREILQNVYRQATRMTKLINDLLDLSRIEAKGRLEFRPKPISVNQLIHSAFEEFKVNCAGRTVTIVPADDGLAILGEFDKLTQVLINLLSNANKYSETDREIIIDTLQQERDGVPLVGIRVTDFGTGIPKADIAKLFDPFFRSAQTMKVPGTGLGMSIVKQIVEFHGGRIDIDSEVGMGTKVTFWIPQAPPATDISKE
jgi:PAS domain S-box-containing protein